MNEPLSISLNLSGTKTAIPMIQDGAMVRLRFVKLSEVKGDKGSSIKLEYDLVDPAPDTDGGQINPGAFGSRIFEQVACYAKADAKDPEWFMKVLAQRVDALLGTADAENKKGKPARPDVPLGQLIPQLIGKELIAKMVVQNDSNFVGNRIKSVTFPGDIAA